MRIWEWGGRTKADYFNHFVIKMSDGVTLVVKFDGEMFVEHLTDNDWPDDGGTVWKEIFSEDT